MAVFLDRMIKGDGFVPDFIAGISKGSYHLIALVNSMMIKWAGVGYFEIDVDKVYSDKKIVKRSSFPENENLKGTKVLICEDDLRRGSGLVAVIEYMRKRGADIRTMSFFSHPYSKINPDFVFQKNIDYRPVFPWNKLRLYAKTKSP